MSWRSARRGQLVSFVPYHARGKSIGSNGTVGSTIICVITISSGEQIDLWDIDACYARNLVLLYLSCNVDFHGK